MMGWASVPYDPTWAKGNPKGQAIMSAAGPLANFLLSAVAWTSLKVMLAYHVVRIAPRPTMEQLVVPVGYASQSPVAALCFALQIFVDLNVILDSSI